MSVDRLSIPWSLQGDQASAARQQALESRLDEIAAEISRLRRERAEAIEEFRAFTTPSSAFPGGAEASVQREAAPTRSSPLVAGGVGTLETLAAELVDRGSRTSSRLEPFETREPEPRFDRSPFVLAQRRPRRAFRLVVPVLLLGAAGATSLWLLGRFTRAEAPRDASQAAPADARPAAVRPAAPDVLPTARSVEAQPEPVGTAGEVPTGLLRIELTTSREVWIRSRVDDQPATARILAAGETVTLEADRVVEVRLGDAGAVTLRLNGEDRGPFGRDGEVLTRRFEANRDRPTF